MVSLSPRPTEAIPFPSRAVARSITGACVLRSPTGIRTRFGEVKTRHPTHRRWDHVAVVMGCQPLSNRYASDQGDDPRLGGSEPPVLPLHQSES